MDKRFLGILTIIILVFVGFVVISNKKSEAPSANKESQSSLLTNNVKGNPDAKVTITIYGDFQCPYCQQYEPAINQAYEANKDKIKLQFRNFPLISLHQNAFASARAAEAAALQGKFWEMHDALYLTNNWQVWTQSSAPTTQFNQYAQQLGLDVAKFKTDFASEKINSTINADLDEANRLGVTATPSFFVNGKKTQINNDPADFQKVIDEALAKN